MAEHKGRPINDRPVAEFSVDLEPVVLVRPVLRRGGRREWPQIARRELDAHRARQAQPVPRDREDRLLGVLGRFEQNHQVELVAHAAYDRWRAIARDTKGRVLKGNTKPFTPPGMPEGVINLSDLDSRVMRTQGTPPRQAYNAQTSVSEQQVILAAEITVDAGDFGHLEPMLDTTLEQLAQHGISDPPPAVLADAGYWNTRQIEAITERGIEVLIPPDGAMRDGPRPGREDGLYQRMRDKLTTDHGRELYAKRKITVEPVYGQIKHNRTSTGSCEEAHPPPNQSGGSSPPLTTSVLKLHNHWIASTA